MKTSNAVSASAAVSAIQISCKARLAFACWLFGSLFSTFAVLCTQQRCSRVFGQTSQSAIGDGEFRRDRQATPLQIEQQGAPVVGALARAVGESDKLLPALRRGAD